MSSLPVPEWLARIGIASWLALGVLGLGAVVVLGMSTFSAIVIPVIFSAVAAAVFVPLVDRFERWRIPRSLGALLAIVIIIGGLAAIVALITRAVIDQADTLSAAFSAAFADLQAWLSSVGIDEGLVAQARDAVTSLVSTGGGGLVSSAASAASSAAALVIGLFFGLVFLYFLMRDAPKLPVWAASNLDDAQASEVVSVSRSGVSVVRRYFTGRAVVALFDAIVIGVGAAVLQIPLVPAIAVLTFVGGFVPYLGAVVAGALAVVLGLASGGLPTALIMLVIVLLTQNVLEPLVEARVIGQSLGLHPMLVIIATTIGGIAAGFSGLILGAPLTATIVQVRNDIRARSAVPPPSTPPPETVHAPETAPAADAPPAGPPPSGPPPSR